MSIKHFLTVGVLCGSLGIAGMSQAALTGHWEFEEGTGATASNEVGGGDVGVITNDTVGGLGTGGSVWVTDPVFGSVISFNGEASNAATTPGAFVQAGTLPLLDLSQDFSWSFIANNLEATQPNNIIVGNRFDGAAPLPDGTTQQADFTPRQFTKFTPTNFEYHSEGNSNDNLNIPDLPVDEWMHHAVVKDGAQLSYYLNGNLKGTSTITQPQQEAMPLFFGGNDRGGTNENWHGLLDDVRIYDEALSESAVQALVPTELAEILGDVNDDGSVTVADFELIRANFLLDVASRADGDLDRSGTVDLDDWNEFKVEFINGGGSLAELNGAIPEPSSAVLLALISSLGIVRRRRT